ERTTPLDEQRLIDRFVTDTHGFIIGEVDLQTISDLLGAPCRRPSPVGPVGLVQSLPRPRRGTRDNRAVRQADVAGEPVLHVLTKPRVLNELRGLRAFRSLLGLPLGNRGPVLLLPATSRSIAAQFT